MQNNFTTQNGISIPSVGLGTWQSAPQDAYNAVRWAIDAGYRHIDTAFAYGNEADVGRAIRDSGVAREQIFVTTKLPADVKDAEGAKRHFYQSLQNLGTDFIDLYLIHAPWPWAEIGKDCTDGNIVVWKEMIKFRQQGLAREIGVSNFRPDDIEPLLKETGVLPSVDQIRFFVGNMQLPVTNYCQSKGIVVEAYSPLATGGLLLNKQLSQIASRYGVSVAQVCIRYCLHKNTLPLPKSVNQARIEQNFRLDFDLSDEDVRALDGLEGTGPYRYLRS